MSQGRGEEQKNLEKNQGRVAFLEENEVTVHSWVQSPLEVYWFVTLSRYVSLCSECIEECFIQAFPCLNVSSA